MPLKYQKIALLSLVLTIFLWLTRGVWLEVLGQGMVILQRWQNEQHRELTRLFMQSAQSGKMSITLVATAWLYGILHAVGPGHGKALITTWMFTQREHFKSAIFTAVSGALIQALSALIWVGMTIGIASWFIRDSLHQTYLLNQISYLLIVATGGYLLLSRSTAHEHSCHCGREHHHQRSKKKYGRLALILGIGMRPCSGALLILAIAISQGMWGIGILMTIAMAVGTAMSISVIAILTVMGRTGIADKISTPQWYPILSRFGGILLIILGLLLFIATLHTTSTPVYLVK